MHIPNILQLDEPLSQFFRRQVHPVSLVGNVMVLAKDAS
jgi:hypothetical protein